MCTEYLHDFIVYHLLTFSGLFVVWQLNFYWQTGFILAHDHTAFTYILPRPCFTFVEMPNNIYLGCFIPLIVKMGTFKLWRLVVWFWQMLRSFYIKSTYVSNGEFWELSMLWRYPIWKRESPNSRTMCSYVVLYSMMLHTVHKQHSMNNLIFCVSTLYQ